MTSAIVGFQQLMLAGTSASSDPWILLTVIILLSYGLVAVVMRRQYKKVLD